MSDDITLKKPVLELLTVANEYCYFLENLEKKTIDEVLKFIYHIVPLLYLKGTLLPDLEVEHPEANEKFITAEQWEELFYTLRKIMGNKDEFWIIDPLYINENEPLKASLSENLTDVYQDLKDFLLLYQKNTFAARENAVKECRILFATHWGYRLTHIMTKVHHIVNERKEEEPPAFF